MTSSKALFFVLLSFFGGVFIASFLKVPTLIIYEFFVLGIFYTVFFFKQKAILVFALCLIALGFGIWRAGLAKLGEDGPPPTQKFAESGILSGLRQKFSSVIEQNISPPQSSILAAILIGDKQGISEQWKEKLNKAGVRHITAISGMHIVILSNILLWFGIVLGLYRGQAFYFAVGLLWLFIAMIGFPPSAVRAGIMGSMFLFCEKIGRQKAAGRTLVLTAAAMLALNPLLLKNIGFQLSFLATLGIIYLMPVFQELFFHLTSNLKPLTNLLSMTLAAQVFTLPVLIHHFGQVSLVSPVTNILIVPLLSYLMMVGFLFIIAGAIFLPLALVFLFPVWLMSTYIIKVVDFFAGLSFSAPSPYISWPWLLLIYSVLLAIIWQIKRKEKRV